MRVLHVSDLHLPPHIPSIPLSDWLGKRLTGAFNFVLRRRGQFASVPFKLEKLVEFAREQAVEAVLCTGDYTLWGTEHEYKTARRAIQPFAETSRNFVTVPGNHDVYTHRVVKAGRFQRHFGDFLQSDAPESAVDGPWPLVRWLGPEVVAIAVNSSVPHRVPWRSSGRISQEQLDALRRLLEDPRMRERFVFVMTHHAPRLANGRPDAAQHRLENADAFLEVCSKIREGAILFGHVHHCYRLTLPELDIALFNAGSATMFRSEGLWLFDVKSGEIQARRGRWVGGRYRLETSDVES